jgi:hypothetical protein
MFSGARADIENAVEWMSGTDTTQWQYQIKVLASAVSDLVKASEPQFRAGTRSTSAPTYKPGADTATAALAHVRRMVVEMRNQNRPQAIEHGMRALECLIES